MLSFDLEGRPISWFDAGRTYKRSLASVVHGRDRVGGERRRFVVDESEAARLFERLLGRVRDAPRDRIPETTHGRIDEISTDHLIGMRFASDAELAELAGRVLAGDLKNRKSIKEAIKNWRADHQRI